MRDDRKTKTDQPNDKLGPDMSLYASRLNEIKEMEKLRKGQLNEDRNNRKVSKMT